MTKKQAIKVLTEQKEKVNNYKKDLIWLYQSLSYIEHIFGKESHEYQLMNSFNRPGMREKDDNEFEATIIRLKRLFDTYIDIVKSKGVKQSPKKNYLSQLSDTWLTTLLALIGGCIFSVGVWVGTFSSLNKEIEKLQKENEKLKQDAELVFVFPNSNPISKIYT